MSLPIVTERRPSVRDAFETTRVLVLAIDREGRVVHWNRGAAELTGYSFDEIAGNLFWDLLLFPEDADRFQRQFREMTGQEDLGAFDGYLRTKSGEVRWIAWTAAVSHAESGGVQLFTAIGVDITSHKRLEDRLQRAQVELEESKAKLVAILDHTYEFIGLLSPDGTLLEANKSSLEFIAASKEQVVGQPFWDGPWWKAFPEHAERLKVAVSEAARGEFVRFQAQHAGANGKLINVDFSLTPVRDAWGRVSFLVPEGRDISERVRAEEALKKHLAEQQLLAEIGTALASTLDYEQTLSTVARLTVRSLADYCFIDLFEGTDVRRVALAHTDPSTGIEGRMRRYGLDRSRPHVVWDVIETRAPVIISEVRKDWLESLAQDEGHMKLLRELAPVSFVGLPMSARGQLIGALVLGSASRSYGEKDLALFGEIAQRAATAVDNARLYRSAQEAVRARDEVLAVVAHDLRNPLNVIALSARASLRGNVQPDQQRVIEGVLRAAQRADRLIEDLLDVARREVGKLSLQTAPCSPAGLVTEAVEMLAPTAEEARVSLENRVPGDLPEVHVDHDRIIRVLCNLLGNSIKFTPRGGRVWVNAELRAQDGVCFLVADNGSGFSPEQREHLFDRFWQAQPRGRGVGLGLAISRSIVEEHGGRIWADSHVGKGSTFTFSVPLPRRPR